MSLPLTNPIFWRGIILFAAIVGGTFIAIMGFRLYLHGITKGLSHFSTESKFIKLTLSGIGPGILFMTMGSFIIVFSIAQQGECIRQDNPQQTSVDRLSWPLWFDSYSPSNNIELKKNIKELGDMLLEMMDTNKKLSRENDSLKRVLQEKLKRTDVDR